jgi:hypothetical protein
VTTREVTNLINQIMASVRRLKKDIQFLSAQLIGDCIDFIDSFNDGKEKQVLAIIEEAVSLHNSMIERACHPDGKANPKLVKKFYQQLKKDFIEGLDQSYRKLEELIQK